MLIISAEQTRNALATTAAAEIVDRTYRAAHAALAKGSTPSFMRLTGQPFRLGAKGAILDDVGIAGIRLTSRAAPRLMLWSLESGEPLALLDESHAYRFRTGISAAVCADYLLAGAKIGRVAIVGTGPIALEIAQAINMLLAPDEIAVAARTLRSAQGFAERADALGLSIIPCNDAAEACDNAGLVVTITGADEVILGADDLHPSAVILSMGGGLEFDHNVWQSAAIRLVDDLDYALSQGDAAGWIATGACTRDEFAASLDGSIANIAAGTISRSDMGRRAMAIVQGMTALDIALAHSIYLSVGGQS